MGVISVKKKTECLKVKAVTFKNVQVMKNFKQSLLFVNSNFSLSKHFSNKSNLTVS